MHVIDGTITHHSTLLSKSLDQSMLILTIIVDGSGIEMSINSKINSILCISIYSYYEITIHNYSNIYKLKQQDQVFCSGQVLNIALWNEPLKSWDASVVACWCVAVEPGRLFLADRWYLKLCGIGCTVGVLFKGGYPKGKSSLIFKQKHWRFRSISWNTKLVVDIGLSILQTVKFETTKLDVISVLSYKCDGLVYSWEEQRHKKPS